MSKKLNAKRVSSALLAAGTGAAVCLTGGSPAHAANGNILSSNATSIFGTFTNFNLFSSKATAYKIIDTLGDGGGGASLSIAYTGGFYASTFSTGVSITSGLSWAFSAFLQSITNKYYGLRFDDSGTTKYGWLHVVDYNAGTDVLQVDTWAYNTLGNSISTLSDSVTTSRLALTDGQEKLHWSNDNEDGVARYEVQSQDASGQWQAADSDVPGSGSYSAKIDSGKTCRLVVEMTDGSTKEIDF
jgi:hypothetical protein